VTIRTASLWPKPPSDGPRFAPSEVSFYLVHNWIWITTQHRRRWLILISCSTQFYLFSDCNFCIWIVKNKCQICKLLNYSCLVIRKCRKGRQFHLSDWLWKSEWYRWLHIGFSSLESKWAYHVLSFLLVFKWNF